jgi:hypothetical protein
VRHHALGRPRHHRTQPLRAVSPVPLTPCMHAKTPRMHAPLPPLTAACTVCSIRPWHGRKHACMSVPSGAAQRWCGGEDCERARGCMRCLKP